MHHALSTIAHDPDTGFILGMLVVLFFTHGLNAIESIVCMVLGRTPLPSSGAPSTARVIVNMPADAQPLSTLVQPGTQVVGSDRATLWYTVYSRTLDELNEGSSDAIDAANEACDKAYGPVR